MVKNKSFCISYALLCALFLIAGCAQLKEMYRGVAGTSTQVLEDKRKDALKKSFALDYTICYDKVKEVLNKREVVKDEEINIAPYIYNEDTSKKMIAIYLSETDTTPVGIFFTETGNSVLIEVSSPSIYAKEEISKRIFSALSALIKLKAIEEQKTDVK